MAGSLQKRMLGELDVSALGSQLTAQGARYTETAQAMIDR
jgi:hypothetical protein